MERVVDPDGPSLVRKQLQEVLDKIREDNQAFQREVREKLLVEAVAKQERAKGTLHGIDYEAFNALGDRGLMTGEWLAHCQACCVPEIASVDVVIRVRKTA